MSVGKTLLRKIILAKWTIPVVWLFVLVSCSPENSSNEKAIHSYFNLHEYFEKQAIRLNDENPSVKKTITKDRKAETQLIRDTTWHSELQLFKNADINRPAWAPYYMADTLEVGEYYLVTYYTEKENLPVRKIMLSINVANGQCNRVSIEKETSNFMYTSFQKLYYIPDSGYQVKGEMDIRWLFNTKYEIEAWIIEEG